MRILFRAENIFLLLIVFLKSSTSNFERRTSNFVIFPGYSSSTLIPPEILLTRLNSAPPITPVMNPMTA
jgi:NADH:ubiquinone oxidoreductase subunit